MNMSWDLFFLASLLFFVWVILPLFYSLSPFLFASSHTSHLDRVLGWFLALIMWYSLLVLCLFAIIGMIRSQSLMIAPVSYNRSSWTSVPHFIDFFSFFLVGCTRWVASSPLFPFLPFVCSHVCFAAACVSVWCCNTLFYVWLKLSSASSLFLVLCW